MTDKELDTIITLLAPKQTGSDDPLQELRAKSPFKTVTERKGRGRKGSASSFGGNTAINRKLNQERAECRSIEFQLQLTFGI